MATKNVSYSMCESLCIKLSDTEYSTLSIYNILANFCKVKVSSIGTIDSFSLSTTVDNTIYSYTLDITNNEIDYNEFINEIIYKLKLSKYTDIELMAPLLSLNDNLKNAILFLLYNDSLSKTDLDNIFNFNVNELHDFLFRLISDYYGRMRSLKEFVLNLYLVKKYQNLPDSKCLDFVYLNSYSYGTVESSKITELNTITKTNKLYLYSLENTNNSIKKYLDTYSIASYCNKRIKSFKIDLSNRIDLVKDYNITQIYDNYIYDNKLMKDIPLFKYSVTMKDSQPIVKIDENKPNYITNISVSVVKAYKKGFYSEQDGLLVFNSSDSDNIVTTYKVTVSFDFSLCDDTFIGFYDDNGRLEILYE